MIFTAMVLVCEINMPKNINTCFSMHDQYVHQTEEECMNSIVELLNSDLFKYAYVGYEVEEYVCYPWLDIEA